MTSPLLQHYETLRSKLPPGTLLLLRLGDFYSIFGGDAATAAPVLGVDVTHPHDVPMCSFPHDAAESYIQRLLTAAHRVAICEGFPASGSSVAVTIREPSVQDIFGPPIFGYSRATAIEDGELVQVGELDRALAGLNYPVAVNRTVWCKAIAEDSGMRTLMLQQARAAIIAAVAADPAEDRAFFDLLLPDGETLPVVIHCGPGDKGEPVFTLCEPSDL